MTAASIIERRALVAVPEPLDLAPLGAVLKHAGLPDTRCRDVATLAREIGRGAGIAIVAESLLEPAALELLEDVLAAQPSWSDLPVLIWGEDGDTRGEGPDRFRRLGHALWLAPPHLPTTTTTAVNAALRHRERQYALRRELETSLLARDEALHLREEAARRIADLGERAQKAEADRDRSEARLAQGRKMEVVGQLAGGIAHELNNLLSAILGNLELIQDLSGNERTIRYAGNALAAVERGAALSGRLLTFSRNNRPVPAPVEIGPVLTGLGEEIGRLMGPMTRIEWRIDPDLHALIDPRQLELALMHAATNAHEAMPGGGILTISAQRIAKEIGPGTPPRQLIDIGIEDTGAGIEPEVAARAFDPFFSTKEHARGEGLGLSQVHETARQAGGYATIEGEAGQGTRIHMLLPVAERGAQSPETSETPETPAGIAENPEAPQPAKSAEEDGYILVVDDDEDVRRCMVEGLESLGHRVVEADHGAAGLAVLENSPPPELLILDFIMPGMNGAEVAAEVLRRHPHLPIVFASGYADTAALTPEMRSWPMLHKPFRISEMAKAISEALSEARGT